MIFVLRLVLAEGFLYRNECLGVPRACHAFNHVWNQSALPLHSTLRVRPIRINPPRGARPMMPPWVTPEMQATLTSTGFLQQVYEKVWMYRIKAKRTKRERREASENLKVMKYFTSVTIAVWENHPRNPFGASGIEIEFHRSRNLPKDGGVQQHFLWPSFLCRLHPDFTLMTALSKRPQRFYEQDGSPPMWP